MDGMPSENIEYLTQLLKNNNTDIITRRKHSYIMYQGVESGYIYVLLDGVVKLSNILRDGREFSTVYIVETDFVSLLEGSRNDEMSAVFNVRIESDNAKFYKIRREKFWNLVQDDPRLFKIVDDFYKRRLIHSLDFLQKMTINGKKGAVCTCITSLIDYFGIQKKDGILIDFIVTNDDIAGFCGISTRNSVNRILRDLKNEKVIDIIDNKIMVYDSNYLKDYIR